MFLVLRAQSIGIPVTRAPLLGLVFNITYTLFSWPAGHWSDRFSRRGMAAAGYIVFAAVYLVFAIAPSTRAIWLAMACYGLFYALTNPVLKALVVETVGFNERTWIDAAGVPHSKDMKVTERIRLLDADNMEIVSTVDDARMYTKPWSFTTHPKRLQGEILEYICNENEADARHLVGK